MVNDGWLERADTPVAVRQNDTEARECTDYHATGAGEDVIVLHVWGHEP